MTDLIAQAKDYLAKTEGITEGEWSVIPNGEQEFSWIEIRRSEETSVVDEAAINLTPTARALIDALVKEVESLKNEKDKAIYEKESAYAMYDMFLKMTKEKIKELEEVLKGTVILDLKSKDSKNDQ